MSESNVQELLTVQQAIRIIDAAAVAPRTIRVPLEMAAGLRLAADIATDRDFPPFRKSLMDGYAVRAADVARTPIDLRVVGEIAAGGRSERPLGAGEAMAIMTGAPMPDGADGVVPVEDVEQRTPVGGTVRVVHAAGPQRYIAARGADCPAGKVVLRAGTLMGPAQIAVAASVGAAELMCFARPRVAVLGTGDELVPAYQDPGPSQMRDSNTPMLTALLGRLGCDVADVGTVADDPEQIRAALIHGLTFDALFVAGGMSMGEYDHVPRLLTELGVDLKITKLRIKPGKPFVFGIGEVSGFEIQGSGLGAQDVEETGNARLVDAIGARSEFPSVDPAPSLPVNPEPRAPNPTFVFGLPGNPVSAFVCTLRLASRLLARMAGGVPEERWLSGRLAEGLPANGAREFYQPAVRVVAPGHHSAQSEFAAITPLAWKGSADLFTLAAANVLIVRAENDPPAPKGALVRVLEM